MVKLHIEHSIWHAFDYLSIETGRKECNKSKLKVLTSNIGHILGRVGVENGLDEFRSSRSLTFEQYQFYLNQEILETLKDDEISVSEARRYEVEIDSVCWLICNPPYLERTAPVFSDHCVLQLWRIFSHLAELVEDEEGRLEVALAASEVEIIAKQLMAGLGRSEDWDPEEFDCVVSVIPAFKFSIFLAVIESKYAINNDNDTLEEAVKELHDYFILDVIKKGKIKKLMDYFPMYREHWIVIQPRKITLYSNYQEKVKRGEIKLDHQCRLETSQSESSKASLKQKPHIFFLHANQKKYEFQASSHRNRLEWMGALSKAVDHSGSQERYQLDLAKQRRLHREEELVRRLSHMDIVEKTKAELEAEKAAREEAEEHAALLTEEKELESRRRKELEDIKHELEQLLEEEKQAKRDEEIVRTLQARMLTEEWERREMLEKMQEEQKNMLNMERMKREEFEKVQEEREVKVKEAEDRIKELEEERKKLDDELKKHVEKSRRMNIGQEVLEVKMKVKEQEFEKDISKNMSLNASAASFLRNSDFKSSYRPLRSASMRETSYSRSIRRRRRNDSVSIRSSIHVEEVNNNGNNK